MEQYNPYNCLPMMNFPQPYPGMPMNNGGNMRIKSEPSDNYSYSHLASELPFAGVPIPDVGEKRKIKSESSSDPHGMTPTKSKVPKKKLKQEKITEHLKPKKKRDRFNGTPEDEVLKMKLPDHLQPDLDIVIVGINPGLQAAYVGHHYAGPGNHFWKCMYLSGLLTEPMNAYDDHKLLELGIGFTNIVPRTTRGSADIPRKEVQEGAKSLIERLRQYKPKIAAFNGKGIYEIFSGQKNFHFGKQPDPLEGTNTMVFVMPSSSARCSQLPRAVDKVPFYIALKKLRDYLTGALDKLEDSDVCFPDLELKVVKSEKNEVKNESKVTDNKDMNAMQQFYNGSEVSQEATSPNKTGKSKRGRKRKSDVKKETLSSDIDRARTNSHGCDSNMMDIKPHAVFQNFYRPYECDTRIKQERDSDLHDQNQGHHSTMQSLNQNQGQGQLFGQNMLVPYSHTQRVNGYNNQAVTSYNNFQNSDNIGISQSADTNNSASVYGQYQNPGSSGSGVPAQYPGTQMPYSLFQPYLPTPNPISQMSQFSYPPGNAYLPNQSSQGSAYVASQISVKSENTSFACSMKSCSAAYSTSQNMSSSSAMAVVSSFSANQSQNLSNSEYSYSSSQNQHSANATETVAPSPFLNNESQGVVSTASESTNENQSTSSTSAFMPYGQTGMSNFITQSNAIISVKSEPTEFGYGGICHYTTCDDGPV